MRFVLEVTLPVINKPKLIRYFNKAFFDCNNSVKLL